VGRAFPAARPSTKSAARRGKPYSCMWFKTMRTMKLSKSAKMARRLGLGLMTLELCREGGPLKMCSIAPDSQNGYKNRRATSSTCFSTSVLHVSLRDETLLKSRGRPRDSVLGAFGLVRRAPAASIACAEWTAETCAQRFHVLQ
jgi:hypothetical protein